MAATIMGVGEAPLGKWVSEECEELSTSASLILQSSMVKGWEKVLRRRAVARLGAARSSRSRAYRRHQMTARRDLILRERGGTLSGLPEATSGLVIPVLSVKVMADESEGESEDEPLIRRVSSVGTFRPSSDYPSSSEEESAMEEDSVMGEDSQAEESESEGPSEEESDPETESDDEVEFLGEESALSRMRSQSLLSRWVVPVVVAEEI